MTRILGIETSTSACSVAVYIDGEVQADHRVIPRQHNRHVLAMAEALLAHAGIRRRQLDAVAFGRGPGSFTGTRIAAGIAQGMALGLSIPVLSLSTLEVLAAGALTAELRAPGAVCALRARPGEIHLGIYQRDTGRPCAGELAMPRAVAEEATLSESAVVLPECVSSEWLFCGDAAIALAGQRPAHLSRPSMAVDMLPEASVLVRMAAARPWRREGLDAAAAIPVYLPAGSPWRKAGTASGEP